MSKLYFVISLALLFPACSSDKGPNSSRKAGWNLKYASVDVGGGPCVFTGNAENRSISCATSDGRTVLASVSTDAASLTWTGGGVVCVGNDNVDFDVLDDNSDSYYVTMSGTFACKEGGNETTPSFEFFVDRGK